MKSIWMTYDLGVGGDYNNLYAWLDDHDAINCGNNVAYFKFDYVKGMSDDDFMARLLSDIKGRVRLVPGNRLYVVRSIVNGQAVKTKGSFIYGKRAANPWEGYGTRSTDTEEEG